MEAWRVYRTAVADSHHIDEEQDLYPDPRYSKKPDLEPHDSEKLKWCVSATLGPGTGTHFFGAVKCVEL